MGQKHLLNPCQTVFSSMGKCGLAVRVDCCDISARVDQQLCHFGAIILLRGVHDQRGHPVEVRIRFHVTAIHGGSAIQQHANRCRRVLACPVERLTAVAIDLIGFDVRAGVQEYRNDLRVIVVGWPMERSVADPPALMDRKRIAFNVLTNDLDPPLAVRPS